VPLNVPPPLDTLPSNVPDFPRERPSRHHRIAVALGVLLAVVATGTLLGITQTVVGFDQVARWAVSIANNARQPGRDVPESRNWAGFTATGGTFTGVSATWSVPQFAPDSPVGADAIWVGIGGVRGTDLIQAGTQETVSGRGTTDYQAWVETLPQASRQVPLPISAGDSVSISLQEQASGSWLVAFKNNTSGAAYQITVAYASSHSSAEWVVEAPSARRGRILPLDTFGSVSFIQAATVKDAQTLTIAQAGGRPITMIGPRRQALARPSALNQDGASFDVLQSLL
jgi:peptidase A4-like protein